MAVSADLADLFPHQPPAADAVGVVVLEDLGMISLLFLYGWFCGEVCLWWGDTKLFCWDAGPCDDLPIVY